MPEIAQGRPVIFGEVLFDVFPGGHRVLGGAPFNVAWHLRGFGESPLFLSRIGRDEAGTEIRALMDDWGLDVGGLQEDPEHPTGRVQITLREGQPSYHILPEQAYDFMDAEPALAAMEQARGNLLCHGSLAARHPTSRASLLSLKRKSALPVFVDINLRSPWWDMDTLNNLLEGVAWLKLNDEELEHLSGQHLGNPAHLERAARDFKARRQLSTLVLTRGAQGALLVEDSRVEYGEPAPVNKLVDTVGAGDAFTAVSILGLLRGWSLPTRLQRALEFAAAVCGLQGATTRDMALYQYHLDQWEETEHG